METIRTGKGKAVVNGVVNKRYRLTSQGVQRIWKACEQQTKPGEQGQPLQAGKVELGCEVSKVREVSEGVDQVNRPAHYSQHPSGVECIQITEHMGFCLGNAVKYIWRAELKSNAVEDLEKAVWYLQRELANRKKKEA